MHAGRESRFATFFTAIRSNLGTSASSCKGVRPGMLHTEARGINFNSYKTDLNGCIEMQMRDYKCAFGVLFKDFP